MAKSEMKSEISKASLPTEAVEIEVKYKRCSKCKLQLPVTSFGRQSRSKDGLRECCRECRKIAHSLRREAHSLYCKKYREENAEKIKIQKKRCVEAKKEYYAEKKKRYYEENKEVLLAKQAETRAKNIEFYRQKQREYYKKNSSIFKYHTAMRRAYLKNATPKFLTDANKAAIRVMYKIAASLEKAHGVKYHVDHIVPLRGENVCGLHVPWNLQVISAEENLKKRNYFNG